MSELFDQITNDTPYMIRNFGNNTLCANVDELKEKLQSDYLGLDVSIHSKTPVYKMINTFFVSIDKNGVINNSHNNNVFDFSQLDKSCDETSTWY